MHVYEYISVMSIQSDIITSTINPSDWASFLLALNRKEIPVVSSNGETNIECFSKFMRISNVVLFS